MSLQKFQEGKIEKKKEVKTPFLPSLIEYEDPTVIDVRFPLNTQLVIPSRETMVIIREDKPHFNLTTLTRMLTSFMGVGRIRRLKEELRAEFSPYRAHNVIPKDKKVNVNAEMRVIRADSYLLDMTNEKVIGRVITLLRTHWNADRAVNPSKNLRTEDNLRHIVGIIEEVSRKIMENYREIMERKEEEDELYESDEESLEGDDDLDQYLQEEEDLEEVKIEVPKSEDSRLAPPREEKAFERKVSFDDLLAQYIQEHGEIGLPRNEGSRAAAFTLFTMFDNVMHPGRGGINLPIKEEVTQESLDHAISEILRFMLFAGKALKTEEA